ncbi:MAG TPA: acyl-CoA thioesterase, partial [Abditibacteriaceae bacterium]
VTLPITVHAFETDYDGIVSNTRYMEYLERGRYSLLRAAGLRIGDVLAEHGAQAVVKRIEIDYITPALHEDELEMATWVESHTGATTTMRSELTRPSDGAVIIRAMQLLAYTNTRHRAVRVPPPFREKLPATGTP